jgi:hypothetical protein
METLVKVNLEEWKKNAANSLTLRDKAHYMKCDKSIKAGEI